MEGAHPRVDVLGRLMVAQQTLDMLPDLGKIAAFLRLALLEVPGIGHCRILLSDNDQEASADAPPVEHCIPVRTARSRFGQICLTLADPAVWRAYEPFVHNLARIVAEMWENRLNATRLAEANHTLNRMVDQLEQRVQERTRDISQAQEALAASEEKFRSIYEGSNDAIMLLDGQGFLDCNQRTLEVFGLASREEFIAHHPAELSPETQADGVDSMSAARQRIAGAFERGSLRFEWLHRRGNGQVFPAEVLLSAFNLRGRKVLQATVRDITRRRQAEEDRTRFTRALSASSASTWALVHAKDERSYLEEVCRIVVDECGYAMAWIGFSDDLPGKPVRPAALAGADEGYLDSIHVSWADDEFGHGPSGTAIRTGKRHICNDMLTDPEFAPWQEQARTHGFSAAIGLPLAKGETIFGSLTIYSRQVYPFTDDEVKVLQEIADHLAYGVVMLRIRDAHARQEATLHESEGRFRALVEQSMAGIYIIQNGRFHYVNPGFAAIFGYPSPESLMTHAGVADLVSPEDRFRVQENIRKRIDGELADLRYAFTGLRRDGGKIAVEVHGHFLNLDGQPAVMGLILDVTDRKKSEERIRKLSLAVEQSPESIVIADLDGTMEYVNDAFLRISGYQRQEVIGHNSRLLKSGKTPRATYEDLWFTLSRGHTWQGEFTNRRKDGSEYIEFARISPIRQANGRITHYVAIKEDITERKRLGQELDRHRHHLEQLVAEQTSELREANRKLEDTQFAMNGVGIGIHWVDPESGRLLYVNRAAAEMLGYTEAELLQRSVPDIDPNFSAKDFPEKARRIREGGAPAKFESRQRAKDGSLRPVEVVTYYLPGAEEGVGRFIAFVTDISPRKEAEAALIQALAAAEAASHAKDAALTELQAANRELDSFAYAISHDLRGPLRALNGFSQALDEDFGTQLTGDAKVYLQQITLASIQMNALVDGLLSLSRSTRGGLQPQRFDLSLLAESILGELAAAEPERQVDWRVEPKLLVWGDGRMLASVMRNLLDNAWKYSAHTPNPQIRVFAETIQGARHYCVSDNGVGFNMAHSGRLFKPFQRLHRQDEFPGLGIGLATALRIIHRHGGEIHGKGAPGEGATFCFTLAEGRPGDNLDHIDA